MPRRAAARVYGHGEIEVDRVVTYLMDFKSAYNSLFAFEVVTARAIQTFRDLPYPFWLDANFARLPGRTVVARYSRDLRPAPEDVPLLVPHSDQLILRAVRLESPGFWEFMGSLNPMEVVRKYLNDRHERSKDKAYRETAEERRLELENLMREEELIGARIRNLKELGLKDRDLAPLVNQLVAKPLTSLAKHQDMGVIEHVEVRAEPDDNNDQ